MPQPINILLWILVAIVIVALIVYAISALA